MHLQNTVDWNATQPVKALNWDMIKTGDRIKVYVPGNAASTRHYEILPTDDDVDSRGDLLVTYLDRHTGEVSTGSTATLGLSLSPDGTRYCWAIPDDSDE